MRWNSWSVVQPKTRQWSEIARKSSPNPSHDLQSFQIRVAVLVKSRTQYCSAETQLLTSTGIEFEYLGDEDN
jgi:hypothetical protein